MKVKVMRLKVKVIHQSQGHSSKSRSELKFKVTVLLSSMAKVIDEGQGHRIESQGHTPRSTQGHIYSSKTRS